MPTLEAGSRPDNIMKSVNAWIDTQIRVGLGLTVYYEGQGRIGALPSTWLETFVIPGSQITDPMWAASDRLATWSEIFLNINVFQIMDAANRGLVGIYTLATTVSNIKELFGPLVGIPVYDYNTVGNPQDGGLSVQNTPISRPIPTPKEMGVEQVNLSVALRLNAVTIN